MTDHPTPESTGTTGPQREFPLGTVASLPPGAVLSNAMAEAAESASTPPEPAAGFPGVISRQREPLNAEFPFPTLHSFHTPNEQFYIRSHFALPALRAEDWTVQVEGHVDKPFELGYAELRKLEAKKITALLECSGNSRILLSSPQLSIRWEQGGVSNAEWTGVPLAVLLERAGVRSGAVEVILEGHDHGKFDDPHPESPGEIHYARSLPLDKARQAEVLLAYQMNGEDLPPDHGFPVRAVVAGWYGMASVKWLKRIIVTDQPFHGMFQTFMYSIWGRRNGVPTLTPVTRLQVKSQIARPMLREIVPKGARYRVFGAAWSGSSEIRKVEISADGGQSWADAQLTGPSDPFSWRFFEYAWKAPQQPGSYTLMSRATDAEGHVQPLERNGDRRDALVNHVQPIEVLVR